MWLILNIFPFESLKLWDVLGRGRPCDEPPVKTLSAKSQTSVVYKKVVAVGIKCILVTPVGNFFFLIAVKDT